MNGQIDPVLDTNALIHLLEGKEDVQQIVATAQSVSISIITAMEFLAYPSLTDADQQLFEESLQSINVIPLADLASDLVKSALAIRQSRQLKLPDAIIAAAALSTGSALVTRDQAFSRVPGLQTISFTI